MGAIWRSSEGAETKRLLYSGKLVGNAKGGLYENLVAGMIERVGLPLFYFKTEDGSREVEFLVERDAGGSPEDQGFTRFLRKAIAVASVRLATPSLEKIVEVALRTVFSDTLNCLAMSALVSPRTMDVSMSS